MRCGEIGKMLAAGSIPLAPRLTGSPPTHGATSQLCLQAIAQTIPELVSVLRGALSLTPYRCRRGVLKAG